MRRQRLCHNCGAGFWGFSNEAMRCCGASCEEALVKHEARLAGELEAAGFERHPATPNLFRKAIDGATDFHVSIEHARQQAGKDGGIETILELARRFAAHRAEARG